VGPAPARANVPPVVLVHGWGCSAYAWRHLMPAIAAAGHPVVAMDLVGHGLSDKPVHRPQYTLAGMANHLEMVLAALGLARPVLIGHSMGGAIAREVARRNPSRVRGLALLAPAGLGRVRRLVAGRFFSPDWVVPFLGPSSVPRWAVRRSLERTWGPRSGFTDRDVDEYWAPSQFPEFVRASRHLIHHFEWAPPAAATLAPLAALPVRVLLGAHDRLLVAPDIARFVAGALPEAVVSWLPDAGHALHEDVPAATLALLLPWLEQVALAH
jgi:pimeloyl-ACP methyl ester carboxylesterase